MSNLRTMRNRILSDLTRSDLSATAEDEIRSAIAHYERESFWFNEQRSSLDTSDGVEFYGLPEDFVHMHSLVVEVNNFTYPLNHRSYDTIEQWFVRSSTFTGYPTDFAIYAEQFRLYPVPNGAYEMTLSYIRRLPTLNNETDSNAWTDTAEEVIRSRAEAQIAARKLRDRDAAADYSALEQEALRKLRHERDRRLMRGKTRRRVM